MTCEAQKADLPAGTDFEKLILDIEVNDQFRYHEATGEFPENQIVFTLDRLTKLEDALLYETV